MNHTFNFTMIYWTGKYGSYNATRVFTHHVEAFTADVIESGGTIHIVKPEGN